ncbi:starch synthase [Parabacteroides sp. PF5-9]|nr:starch synthase [Parabacteroides sp. PF5-9]
MKEIYYLCTVLKKQMRRMDAKKILFIAQEITPYLPESEIATISRNLPQGIQERGREIRTFMPKFGNINERRNQLHEVIRLSGMNLIIDDTDHPLIIKVASIQSARMQVYFIDNEDFFQRKQTIKDESGNEYEDNDDRSIFYVRGVLETVKKLRWIPDVIHCHGWMSALTALYIKRMYVDDPCLKDAKIVYSIYNDNFQIPFRKEFPNKLKMDGAKESDIKALKSDTSFVGLTKLAIDFADGVIQGSETIDQELLDYIKTKKDLPFLPYQAPDSYIDEFNAFYDVILDTSN